MTDSRPVDVLVIGAGVVGLGAALAIQKAHRGRVVVLEKEPHVGAHQTGNNSGVIHAGLYYKPGSLKASTCKAGREALIQFCQERGVPWDRCGKLVVATTKAEIPRLDELERRGAANGLFGMKRLVREEIEEYEPNARGEAALFIQETGITDYRAVAAAYADALRERGGDVVLGAKVLTVTEREDRMHVETTNGGFDAKLVVSCAGLHADRIAKLSGDDPGVRIVPFRGEYYKLKDSRAHLVKNLIYPVPNPEFPFLGVHFTRLIEGGVEAGPNAVLAWKREGYTRSFSLPDAWNIVSYGGFWTMARKYWKTGLGEVWRSWNKQAFAKALSALVPEITADDLVPAGAGVRAQAMTPDGGLVDDFRVLEGRRVVHVLNAPSPAATASLAIGELIRERAMLQLS